jgi:uncharacterized protein DUF3008
MRFSFMPSTSIAQQQFMGAELARKRAGKKTRTGMSEKQLEEFAATKHAGLPEHKHPMHQFRRGNGVN